MTTHESNNTTKGRARKSHATTKAIDWTQEPKGLGADATDFDPTTGKVTPIGDTTPAPKRARKASAANKALAETIKAAAEAEVAEVIELKVRNRKASTTTARKPKAEPTTAPAPTTTAPTAVAGYVVRWPHAGYDLLKSDGTHDGATWLVRCNAHGATTEAANTKSGDQLGRKADRAAWCAGCQA